MKRLFAIGALLAALVSPASAQLTMTGVGGGSPASGGGTPAFTANANPAHQNLAFGSGTATFSGVATGAGLVIVAVEYFSNNTDVTSVTLNTNPMTLAVGASSVASQKGTAIYYLGGQTANPSSTIQVSNGAAFGSIAIQTASITNVTAAPTATTSAAYASPADPHSIGPLTIPASGFGVAAVLADSGGAAFTIASGSFSIDFQTDSGIIGLLSHSSTSGSQSAAFTAGNFVGWAAAYATWGP